MNFVFKKQQHTGRLSVWYDGIFLGEIFSLLKENKDIDWAPYRADKSLKMSPGQRYAVTYIPIVKIGNNPSANLNGHASRQLAAETMLDFHRNTFQNECN